jgi:hypothetical protein
MIINKLIFLGKNNHTVKNGFFICINENNVVMDRGNNRCGNLVDGGSVC